MDNKKDTSKPQGYELVNFCEFDKFAEQSYCAVHGVDASLNLGDITKVDETKIKPFSMICGGSPCQDFSVAGKGEGSKWKCADCEHEYNPLLFIIQAVISVPSVEARILISQEVLCS